MRHFKVKTAAGAEDVYCDDFDDSDEKEYWFIFYHKPRLIFQKVNVISLQEQAGVSEKLLSALEAEAEKRRKFERSRQLRYDV